MALIHIFIMNIHQMVKKNFIRFKNLLLKHNSRLNNMIEQVYSHAKYQIILFLDMYWINIEKIGYISKISDIFDFFEKIMIFSIPANYTLLH